MPYYQKLKTFFRKAFTPVTIMFIPHDNSRRSLNLNVPAIGVFLSTICSIVGAVYLLSMLPDAIRYQEIEKELLDYSKKVVDFKTTLVSLKKAEQDLHHLISLGSKEKIFDNVDTSDIGSLDIDQVQEQIESSMKTVGAIKDYLRSQKDIYLATPNGFPVQGTISSTYGNRVNPISGRSEFHRGLDISTAKDTPVTATADGVIVFSGWNRGGGNVVVIAHGHGFSTYYAHNRMNTVQVGQSVKRGDVIAYVGSTGSATGSHVHYEVWHNGKNKNPINYIDERS
ncbi:MAG TPA: M23 family metallopeptidase [Syntrophales bacterium]|nr:M23 family metallopeptidase [Syntrophales bacterium]